MTELVYKFDRRNRTIQLSDIFSYLNNLKTQGLFFDFAITRSSLEHVFIHFAKFQISGG